MGLISKVGQNRGYNLALMISFYFILFIGSVTMVVPFLMTLTMSVTNQYDLKQYNIVPKFLYDDESLFIKYLFLKYNQDNAARAFEIIKNKYHISDVDTLSEFSDLKNPIKKKFGPLEYDHWNADKLDVAWKDYEQFWEQIKSDPSVRIPVTPLYYHLAKEKWSDFLQQKYVGIWTQSHPKEAKTLKSHEIEKASLALLNSTYGHNAGTDFQRIQLRGNYGDRGRIAFIDSSPRSLDYEEFMRTLPAREVTLLDMDEDYRNYLKEQYQKVEKLNAAWKTNYRHLAELRFTSVAPVGTLERSDWERYVKTRMSLSTTEIKNFPPEAQFKQWLIKKYGSLEGVNRRLKTDFKNINEISVSAKMPLQKQLLIPWVDFAAEKVAVENYQFPSAIKMYHEFLIKKYGTVEGVNATYGQSYTSIESIRLPQTAFDRAEFLTSKGKLIWFFLTNNFVVIFKELVTRGNALWNTLFLVGANLIAGLTINPMAAYALSRFKIKNKHLILMFFLLPMAFPGEVMQIPSFILTRDLGLLNTYWALILPGLANGFAIFLMKGFFDGLPRELYEAAELDGASEWQIYWNVTFPMCKPILALSVLGIIIASYSEFMWALLICPDQRKWTLAVWIFQFAQDAVAQGQGHLQMASLVLMSIPTMIVFIITQKIIMKGIILPTMK